MNKDYYCKRHGSGYSMGYDDNAAGDSHAAFVVVSHENDRYAIENKCMSQNMNWRYQILDGICVVTDTNGKIHSTHKNLNWAAAVANWLNYRHLSDSYIMVRDHADSYVVGKYDEHGKWHQCYEGKYTDAIIQLSCIGGYKWARINTMTLDPGPTFTVGFFDPYMTWYPLLDCGTSEYSAHIAITLNKMNGSIEAITSYVSKLYTV